MVYEKTYRTSKEMYKEYIRRILCHSINIRLSLIAVALLVCAALTWNIRAVEFAWLFVAAFAVTLFIMFIFPKFLLWRCLKNEKKIFHGAAPEYNIRFGDSIEYTCGDTTSVLRYDQFSAIVRLKTCRVLMMDGRPDILLPNDSPVRDGFDFDCWIPGKLRVVDFSRAA